MEVRAVRCLRRDIQGLRALAVLLVLVFHLWPKALPGGFVGVDAFFVISGYLISEHLRRELESTGTIQLAEFWARRARRLLPASFTVLLVSLLATWAILPLTLWRRSMEAFAAATAYCLNWFLAFEQIDYWNERGASPVQHFWSLSVEEQFYLVWPLLLLLVSYLARKSRMGPRAWIRGAIALVALLSLSASVISGLNPEEAHYFVTWNRAWEFAAGGLLAFVDLKKGDSSAKALVGLGGAIVLCASGFLISAAFAYPGWLALIPVGATMAAIAFGQESSRLSLDRLLAARPVQWIGDVSYGIYLWHWPLIALSNELSEPWRSSGWERGWIIFASFALAAATKRFVEDPFRFGNLLTKKPPGFTFAATLLAMCLLGGSVHALHNYHERLTTVKHELVEATKDSVVPCFGANREPGCSNPRVEGRLFPEPWAGRADLVKPCIANNRGSTRLKVCKRGYLGPKPKMRTAIVGDSHAGHWSVAFEHGARERKEQVLHMMKGSCPFSLSERDATPELRQSCEEIKKKIWSRLKSRKDIRRVVLSASSLNDLVATPGLDKHESAVRGYERMLRKLPKHIREVIVIRDVPRPMSGVIPCLERLSTTEKRLAPGACARPISKALLRDPLADAARRVGGRVKLLDFSDAFCDEDLCYPVRGNVLVYGDDHHLSGTFARTLVPRLRAELAQR